MAGWKVTWSNTSGTTQSTTLPSLTLQPSGGRLLVADSGYSLGGYGSPNTTVALSITPVGIQVTDPSGTVSDAVGETTAPATFRSGTGLTPPSGTGQMAWVRKVASGAPVNTSNNAADFAFVATDANTVNYGVPEQLGAPEPQPASSGVVSNVALQAALLDSSASASAAPNRVYDASTSTLTVRRTVTNTSPSVTYQSARLRLTSITTYQTPPVSGQAILAAQTSSSQTVTTSHGSVTVEGITLDQPPTQAAGGGLNASLTVPLPAGGLAPGASVAINLVLHVAQGGHFSFGFNVEASATVAGKVSSYTDSSECLSTANICSPLNITTGPDGALWFTNEYTRTPNGLYPGNSIGRITTSGVLTHYTSSSISAPDDITTGPDGALWFTNNNNTIGRITTSGVVTSYADPSISAPRGITVGSDGALWFTNVGNNSIGRITTSGAVTNYTDPFGARYPNVIYEPWDITAGPDGALWFTNEASNTIGRITTSGSLTYYQDPSIQEPEGITTGPDGALWFANNSEGSLTSSIGRITTSGAVTSYPNPNQNQPEIEGPTDIASGPDGALWFTNGSGSTVGRITTSGAITVYGGPNVENPGGITAGPENAVWFTSPSTDTIGRIATG